MSDERERLFVGDNNLDDLRQMWEETNTPALHKRSSAKLRVLLDWALPKLIGEVKRCYEEIDALQGKIDDAHEAMEKYSNEEIDNVCDAYEEVCLALD
tara:strand:+ start:172 stop:465 length:294 start_codon:yes stop_codon:yes gene_type:complete